MIPKANSHADAQGAAQWRLDPKMLQRATVVLIALFVAARTAYLLSSTWVFTTDDAYITLRYARHFAEGHGITWNIGEEPVEGYSNFLFVILGASALKAGIDPVLFLKILSCLALAGTCVLTYLLARPWVGPIGATLPAAMLTLYEGTIFWTPSGLETVVYQMLVVASVTSFFLAFHPGERIETSARLFGAWRVKWLVLTGLLVFLVGLTRPEGPLIGVAMGLALVVDLFSRWIAVRKHEGPAAARVTAVSALRIGAILGFSFVIPYAIYFGWRLGHFGRLLPNSFYCKMDFDGDPLILIKEFWATAWPAFGLAGIALITLRRRLDARITAIIAAVVLYLIVFYGVDPLISRMNRHFLTAFALLLVLTTIGLFGLIRVLLPRVPGYLTEFAVMLWLLAGTAIFVPGERRELAALSSNYAERMAVREELGRWLDDRLSPEDLYVIGDAGMVPYVTRAKVLDAYCLNSAAVTRPPISRSPDRFVDHWMQRRPDVIVVHSTSPDSMIPHTLHGVFPDVVERDQFETGYTHTKTMGLGMFNYWVFERNH